MNNVTSKNGNISIEDIKLEADKLLNSRSEDHLPENLKIVLATQKKLRDIKSNDIKFTEPVLLQDDNPVIFPHTINVIQGQAGVHKSRLAEIMCAAFLKQPFTNGQSLLGFKRNSYDVTHTVVYVDTERNLTEQLPYALQMIQIKAGYNKSDHPEKFEYISLLQINRKDRFNTLNAYLDRLRKSTVNSPLFIVLDVTTDCIEDFNKTDKSMELIDLMNIAINEHNVIFLCLIHENPRTDKARGHLGTELMNKSSTVIQVSFEKDSMQNDTDIIRVKYLKCRSTAKHPPFYIKYSKEHSGLVLAEAAEVSTVMNNRKQKASNEQMVEYLEMYLGDGSAMTRTDLLEKLCTDFDASKRTIEERITELMHSEIDIFNSNGKLCKLIKEKREKTVSYKLCAKDE